MLASEIFRRVVPQASDTRLYGAGSALAATLTSGQLEVPTALLQRGTLTTPMFVSPEIDFTAAGDTVLIPPISARLLLIQTFLLWLTQVGGTRSVAPNIQVGSNAAVNDFAAAQAAAAAILTQAANTRLTVLTGTVTPAVVPDLSAASGLVFRVNTPLTGTSPVCKGRIVAMTPLFML